MIQKAPLTVLATKMQRDSSGGPTVLATEMQHDSKGAPDRIGNRNAA
jgi:hypothetical protein